MILTDRYWSWGYAVSKSRLFVIMLSKHFIVLVRVRVYSMNQHLTCTTRIKPLF